MFEIDAIGSDAEFSLRGSEGGTRIYAANVPGRSILVWVQVSGAAESLADAGALAEDLLSTLTFEN